MTTKTTGTTEGRNKTVVTNNRADPVTHNLDEGCSREPMYSHKIVYDGVRNSYQHDSEHANGMVGYD